MAIKESSDELNPPVLTNEAVIGLPRSARSAKDYLAVAIATCGVGYLPVAPGTWGSLVALAAFWYSHFAFMGGSIDTPAIIDTWVFVVGYLGVVAIITFVGIWASSRTERALKLKDPGKVVIDEVAGQLVALAPLGLTRVSPLILVIAFVFFRFFDIVKPYPARKFESLHGGLGIMADDLIAGLYAAGVVLVAANLI